MFICGGIVFGLFGVILLSLTVSIVLLFGVVVFGLFHFILSLNHLV